ncbi:MAG TPA: PaaI family thioesterase [Acidimicrobiales bacterium]|nr:PaaI family thioesterase [Acidimicrobiales bacterium]
MPLPPPEFPAFDPAVAEGMVGTGAVMAGIPEYLGIRTVEAGAGRLVAEVAVREELLNPFGALHGAVLSALADHVLGAVVYTVVERGYWAATTEFKLNFLAPVRTGTVRAESSIISMSRRTAVVRIDMENEGRAVAAVQGTVTIVPPRA